MTVADSRAANAAALPSLVPLAAHTPMMQQYLRVKSEHPDKLVFYRMGDFYGFSCGRRARLSPPGHHLTARGQSAVRPPHGGVPYHAIDQHLRSS